MRAVSIGMHYGREKAEEVLLTAGTRDVFEIARRRGVMIKYESWYPVTAGEFEKPSMTIYVNERALGDAGRSGEVEIIAHELGHAFAVGLNLDRRSEEEFADEFADGLLGR